MKILDNFLSQEEFNNIKNVMTGRNFPWYYAPCANNGKDNLSHLTYYFYTTEDDIHTNGDVKLIKPILDKLKYTAIIRIKANLTYPSINKGDFYHNDNYFKNTTTAVFYLNDNNGGTKFKIKSKIKFIESKANRMIIFPSHIQHSVVRHNNNDLGRFVINFNYYTDEKI
jgi:Rps23 Pro-64 3,4-dihydroxylase Tpa1-like proline 4-hydroxylase